LSGDHESVLDVNVILRERSFATEGSHWAWRRSFAVVQDDIISVEILRGVYPEPGEGLRMT
jgi:hypothetical protein